MGCNSSNTNNTNDTNDTNINNEIVVTYVQADSLASTLKTENKDVLVVDVRDVNEYSAWYIKDAINVPSAQFDDDAAKSNLLDHIKVSLAPLLLLIQLLIFI